MEEYIPLSNKSKKIQNPTTLTDDVAIENS
jgi:hypothetical protein